MMPAIVACNSISKRPPGSYLASYQDFPPQVSGFQVCHDVGCENLTAVQLSDDDWQHRARKKLRICTQFAAKIEAFKSGTPMTYKDAYAARLREILLEELGPTSLKKIEDEAAELARNDVGRH